MKFLETLFTILQIFSAIIVMILVLLQNTKEDGNIITGSSNKGGSLGMGKEEKLARITKYFGIAFIILTIASGTLMLINY